MGGWDGMGWMTPSLSRTPHPLPPDCGVVPSHPREETLGVPLLDPLEAVRAVRAVRAVDHTVDPGAVFGQTVRGTVETIHSYRWTESDHTESDQWIPNTAWEIVCTLESHGGALRSLQIFSTNITNIIDIHKYYIQPGLLNKTDQL